MGSEQKGYETKYEKYVNKIAEIKREIETADNPMIRQVLLGFLEGLRWCWDNVA